MNEDYFGRYEWDNKTILIVEDDISSAFYLKEVLTDTNAELIFVKDGQSAINLCRDNKSIDLVLMDIQLPVIDGFDATIEIKKMRPDLPVIAQTAYALIEERQRCYEVGCDDYIAKPIEPLKLLDKIKNFM